MESVYLLFCFCGGVDRRGVPWFTSFLLVNKDNVAFLFYLNVLSYI